MFKKPQVTQRSTVTVEDRRAVLVATKARKPAEVAKVPHEVFLRHELKARLGWPQREPAPASVLAAVKEMAEKLKPVLNALEDGKRARTLYDARMKAQFEAA
jgi:hypothetical protein